MIDFSDDIEKCLEVLQKGGIILYPTDTVWGLGCDATNQKAAEKIISLKQRPKDKSFVILVTSEKEIIRHVAAPDLALFNYLETVTKPVTVVYEHALGLAENVIGADGSAAIRICRDEFCRRLIKQFRKPIVSTSANIHTKPAPDFFSDIDEKIKKGVDYIVKYRQDDFSPAYPSTIIRWKNGKITVIRS